MDIEWKTYYIIHPVAAAAIPSLLRSSPDLSTKVKRPFNLTVCAVTGV
jgi:hypothetical protein